MDDNLKLVYVNPIGKNSSGWFEYEFFFSKTPDIVWGQDWNVPSPASCGDMKPDETTYNVVKRLKSNIPFSCAQKNSCFSMQDMIDNIIACAWEDISDYDEFPEPYRIVFQFGEEYSSVETKMASRSQFFDEKDVSYGNPEGDTGNGEDENSTDEDNELNF